MILDNCNGNQNANHVNVQIGQSSLLEQLQQHVCMVWFLLLTIFNEAYTWLSQSSIMPFIYCSQIVKLCSNPFLEPTSALSNEDSFLIKVKTGPLMRQYVFFLLS